MSKVNGALFKNKYRKNISQPYLKGHITLSRDQLRALVKRLQNEQTVELQLDCWESTSKKGDRYLTVVAHEPYEKAVPKPASLEGEFI